MDNIDDNVIEVLQTVILGGNRRNKELTREELVELLVKAGGDPNKALDYYYLNGEDADLECMEYSDTEKGDNWTQKAQHLKILLGSDVPPETIRNLLERTKNDIEEAVEIYFSEPNLEKKNDESRCDMDTKAIENKPLMLTSNRNRSYPQHVQRRGKALERTIDEDGLVPIEPHLLQPLSPRVRSSNVITCESTKYLGADTSECTGTYSVNILENITLGWEIENVFGRLVVQKVDPAGVAAGAGICKSDVLVAVNDAKITRENSAEVKHQLVNGLLVLPSILHLRRLEGSTEVKGVPSILNSEDASAMSRQVESQDPNRMQPQEANLNIPDGLCGTACDAADQQELTEEPFVEAPSETYGLKHLETVAAIMMTAIDDASANIKSILELLLLAELSTDVALNNYFDEQRPVPDFRHVIGYDWNPLHPQSGMKGEVYEAEIPAGPLGLTVENILERTVVVDLKPNGAAAKAGVIRSSWMVGLNGENITDLTHKETLTRIEKADRPLILQLLVLPSDVYKQLRKQLSTNIRQPKTERLVPEQDRMSFRVFQSKIHQAILHFPFAICRGLYKYLNVAGTAYFAGYPISGFENVSATSLSSLSDPSLMNVLSELSEQDAQMPHLSANQMSPERRFLLNLFASVHDHEDKGENIVIRTILYFGSLGARLSTMYRGSRTADIENCAANESLSKTRYLILIAMILYVLESLAIIENHASWDAMINSMRIMISAMSDYDIDNMVVPMISRLSISSSPTARIVPIALLPDIYLRVTRDVRVQVRGMVDRMVVDDNPLVRRAVTSKLEALSQAAGTHNLDWIVHLLEKATSDSHDIVRVFAIKSCVDLASVFQTVLKQAADSTEDSTIAHANPTLRLLHCRMLPLINSYVSDSSWQVRLETAKVLPKLCLVFGKEYADIFVDHFVGIVQDATVEVRKASVEAAYELAESLIAIANLETISEPNMEPEDQVMEDMSVSGSSAQVLCVTDQVSTIQLDEQSSSSSESFSDKELQAAQSKIIRSILPAMYCLATDISIEVRLSLARSVGKSLSLIGEQNYADLVPIFTQFLDESQESRIRAALLEETTKNLRGSADLLLNLSFPVIRDLLVSPSWRIRVQSIYCVAAWARNSDASTFPKDFAEKYLQLLSDPICEVRSCCCTNLSSIISCLGSEWMTQNVLTAVYQRMRSTFNGRLTGLCVIDNIASELNAAGKLLEILEMVIEICTSKIPNLRFRALRTLVVVVPFLEDDLLRAHIVDIVKPMADSESESDPDVRHTALDVLARLCK